MINRKKEVDNHYRLGVVSYLNAKPLVQGLDQDSSIRLVFDVPSRLARMLDDDSVDVALVPTIDIFQAGRSWQIVSDACIGCNGETLTVRIYSRVPAAQVRRLHVDGDSHTSVVLAQVIWRRMFRRVLEVYPYTGQETPDECEAILLIGDKVVNNTLIDYDIETDLGAAWKSLTGLPFVFAAWAAPRDRSVAMIAHRLSRARDEGVRAAAMIAEDYGPGLGWPVALAKRYLTSRLKFVLGPRQREAIARFVEWSEEYQLIAPRQEIVYA